MMVDVLSKANEILNISGFGFGEITNLIVWLVISLVFLVFFCVIFALIMWVRLYRHKIIVRGMLGNVPAIKWTDRARVIHIGTAGDQLFYLRKKRRYIPFPTIQSGKNEWWFWEREDNELINVGLGNVDETMKKMGIKFVHADMRMQRLGIEKNLRYRLENNNFWEKYGDKLMNFGFYVIITILLIIVFYQFAKTAPALENAIKAADNLLDKADSILSKSCDSAGSGKSGLIPALILPLTLMSKTYGKQNF